MQDSIRLYYKDDKSDKIYIAAIDGTWVVLQWGRVGSKLQSKDYSLSSSRVAINFYLKKVSEKRSKGYVNYQDSQTIQVIPSPPQTFSFTYPKQGPKERQTEKVFNPEIPMRAIDI